MKNLFKLTITFCWLLQLISQQSFAQQNRGLPLWPLATAHEARYNDSDSSKTPNQFINWENSAFLTLLSDSTEYDAAAQAAFDNCGDLVFFILHTGSVAQNQLKIYDFAGEDITPSSGGMNANQGDEEIQVIKRPGYHNQWYIIYTNAPIKSRPSDGWSAGSPVYVPSYLKYSLIKIDDNEAEYVTINSTVQKDILLLSAGENGETITSNPTLDSNKYIHGKAVMHGSVTAGSNDYDLYIQRRDNKNDNTGSVDRFEISSSGIRWTANSDDFNSYAEGTMAASSEIEISNDGTKLAVYTRLADKSNVSVQLFNLSSGFSEDNSERIFFKDLYVVPDLVNASTTGYNPSSVNNYQTLDSLGNSTGYLRFLKNMPRKISAIEFSDNGRYLYIAEGGFESGGVTNLSYIGQIDLVKNSTLNGYLIRLQTQSVPSWDSNDGHGLSLSNFESNTTSRTNLLNSHIISKMQKAYDGNLYFRKVGEERLFVLPNINNPMPVELVPHQVDFSSGSASNIITNGYPLKLPDQIDGYNYEDSDFTKVTLNLENNRCDDQCEDIQFSLIDQSDSSIFLNFTLDKCQDTLSFCVLDDRDYTLITEDSLEYVDAISQGIVDYPESSSAFNLQKDYFVCCPTLDGINPEELTIYNMDDNVISTNTVWDGKVFLEDNTTLYIDGVNLDVTNVDVVFGSCASIVFQNGATLNAKNSVFRPCDRTQAWGGLKFQGSEGNSIVECTFENARTALLFSNGGSANIHDNTFLNCSRGLSASYTGFDKPISNNQFIIDDEYPLNADCIYSNVYFISTGYCTLSGGIRGNTIRNLSDSLEISSAISATSSSSVKITNNIIENVKVGINVTGSGNYSEITGNTILNTFANLNIGINSRFKDNISIENNSIIAKDVVAEKGIESYYNESEKIAHNYIEGVERGIGVIGTEHSQVIDNQIYHIDIYGIFVDKIEFVNVACNEIDMDQFYGNLYEGVGIRYSTYSSSGASNKIMSNCISNSVNAVYLSANSSSTDLPQIRNNFFYNYGVFGIYSDDITGNIGSISEPGMNSFYSNSNASDVYSVNGTLTLYDNYSLSNYNYPNVVLASNVETYSIAKCAKMVDGVNNQSNGSDLLLCEDPNIMTLGARLTSVNLKSTDSVVYEEAPMNYKLGAGEMVELGENVFDVFPNPVESKLEVYLVNNLTDFKGSLSVYTIDGLEVYSTTVDMIGGYVNIDLSSLKAGMYFVGLKNNKDEVLETKKFVKIQ